MVNSRFILTLLVFVLIASCTLGVTKSASRNASTDEKQCKHISSETAVLIAKGRLFLDYDLRNYDVSSEEKENSWEIHFLSRCRDCEGGDPFVEKTKADGTIVRLAVPK